MTGYEFYDEWLVSEEDEMAYAIATRNTYLVGRSAELELNKDEFAEQLSQFGIIDLDKNDLKSICRICTVICKDILDENGSDIFYEEDENEFTDIFMEKIYNRFIPDDTDY